MTTTASVPTINEEEGPVTATTIPTPATMCMDDVPLQQPHAFHVNLPPHHHHHNNENGVPYITRLAHAKARKIIQLAHSIQLTEALFLDQNPATTTGPNNAMQVDTANEEEEYEEEEDLDVEDGEDYEEIILPATNATTMDGNNQETIQSLTKKLSRLQAQWSGLEAMKYSGITPLELCKVVLHLLRLVTCTIEFTTPTTAAPPADDYVNKDTEESNNAATTTTTCDDDDDDGGGTAAGEDGGTGTGTGVKLHYETVGYLWQGVEQPEEEVVAVEDEDDAVNNNPNHANSLDRPFALHSPAREVILLILINILSNKGPLRAFSNASIYPETSELSVDKEDQQELQQQQRCLLILHWKALLRTLLRTAPYLDEKRSGPVRSDSNYRQTTVLKRTVQLIRDARHFFDQGIRPQNKHTSLQQPGEGGGAAVVELDKTAKQVWDLVQTDVLFHSHTHACYRGTILLYLFHPSRCSSEYYDKVLPLWWNAWTNIDRCPEYDFLYLACFCRARKHIRPVVSSSSSGSSAMPQPQPAIRIDGDLNNDSSLRCFYDWGPIRRRLLTHAQYWLQLPIGGAALDKSFPRASNPRSRSCPPRLKVFTGTASSYEEGIDFVAKVVKLLVTSLGTGLPVQNDDYAAPISEGTNDLLRFLSFVTPYFNPSNIGAWTFTLGAFLHYFAYELCCRMGATAGARSLQLSNPDLARAMAAAQPGAALEIPPAEVVALLDVLLPLCQQAIYSKNPHVGRAGEAALLYLVQMDPARSTPSFIDFASRALDIVSVNLSHQAPSALSALTRLIQPALRSDASVLLLRLPDILSLSLAGIDSNDQNKTIRTLILYRSLASWLPVGGTPETWSCLDIVDADDGECDATATTKKMSCNGTMRIGSHLLHTVSLARECPEYLEAIARLPPTSLLKLGVRDDSDDPQMQRLALDEAISALSDWAVEFLDRVFGLLRASGEREKAAKTSSGVATRHSTADVHQARNFSRVLTECLMQLFASMEDEVHSLAVRAVVRFLEEETHPSAAKDASLLCQATAAARTATLSPGLDALIPVLTDDFHRHSTKTVIYRIRCLAGAVRSAGRAVMTHSAAISKAIEYALSSEDRHLFKTGCKLLRHTLSTLSESYPLASDSRPRVFRDPARPGSVILGRSGQLHGDPIKWHVPDASCIRFASELLETHVNCGLSSLCCSSGDSGISSSGSNNEMVPEDDPAGYSSSSSKLLHSTDIQDLRRCLRVIRYSIRGGASILLDEGLDTSSDDVVAYEIASYNLIEAAGPEVKDSLLRLRGRMTTFLIALSSVIASDTLYPDALATIPENDPSRKFLPLISSDPKVCKETCDLALLLLTRRGALFRSQEARTIWKAQKQVAADFTLCAQVDRMTETLQSAAVYGSSATMLYKDGEDAGKTVPRRLLVARVQLFHTSLQRNASFEVPRRMRRLEREQNLARVILFSVKPTWPEMVAHLESMLKGDNHHPLDAYEGIIDGLFALCCHSNTQVRASAISVVDYAMTRFGWIVAPRVPRMLSGLSLQDARMNGKFGVPSCALLVDKLSHQGKRKRLAEAVKGVCSILSLTRAVRQMLGSWKMRHRFVETLCGTDHLVSLLPAEEMQKIIHYLQAVFSPFRSSFYSKPRTSAAEIEFHEKSICFVLDILSERKAETGSEVSDAESIEKRGAHWRKLLIASWFLLVFVDEGDIKSTDSRFSNRIWTTCFYILETNFGQPLQRVALGLFGKLICLLDDNSDFSELRTKMASESFCKVLGKALVYDHKEDTSVSGGHDAQWSSGVETIIRDASRHVAPRTLFPFQRTSQSLGSFKVPHSQFIELLMSTLDEATAFTALQHLLVIAKELAAAPPSEDQRNQQITAAEIYAGVCGSLIRSSRLSPLIWSTYLLPFLDEALIKTPFSLCGAYFDAIRYALQFASPESFYPLTVWLTDKIKSTLWQPNGASASGHLEDAAGANGSTQGTEGFTAQSKWLYLFSAVLIEMDETESDDVYTKPARFVQHLTMNGEGAIDTEEQVDGLERSWQLVIESLLPRLTEALGHPFDSCRDHISRCLFRICYSHRKITRTMAAKGPGGSGNSFELTEAAVDSHDPGWMIVHKLASLQKDTSLTYKDKFNALITARRFISHCVHLGEAKFEFSDFVIPLLPLAFEALDATSDDEVSEPTVNNEDSASRRALEAEVVKGFRGMISEVSVTAVISYGSDLDMARVLDGVEQACKHEKWQVRHAGVNFLRCFQGAHKFLFRSDHTEKATAIVTVLLADERREVSSAAMAALTGILAASPAEDVARMVVKYAKLAEGSKMRKPRKSATPKTGSSGADGAVDPEKERKRSHNQQESVFFLCATIMARPYDTPAYVPEALAAISTHSFERNAPLGVRDTVKRCCAEYKRTHMSDNWEEHRRMFKQEQLEAFEDVVSSPHYYA